MTEGGELRRDYDPNPFDQIRNIRDELVKAEVFSKSTGLRFLSYILGMAIIEATELISSLEAKKEELRKDQADTPSFNTVRSIEGFTGKSGSDHPNSQH